jgi:cytochrome b subunit of formate dehydrogenase
MNPVTTEPGSAQFRGIVLDPGVILPPVEQRERPTTGRKASRESAGRERRRVARTPRTHLWVTICHWTMVVLLAINLLSGMRIGWGFQESPLGGQAGVWAALLARISPKATLFGVNLITLHVISAVLMFLVIGVYAAYLIRSKTTARLRLTWRDLVKLWRGLRSRTFWRNKAALWSANVIVYWAAFLFIAALVVTGVAMYRLESGLSDALGGYSFMRLVHAALAYLFLPLIALHGVLQWFFGRFWAIFKAQFYRKHVDAGIVALALTLPTVAGLYLWDRVPETLTVSRITAAQAPQLDGEAIDRAWSQTSAVMIRTVKGINNPQDFVDVTVKAVHDGKEIYFLFAWDDPEASYKRYPLQKTENGWKVLQTAFERADENVYYEDKLAAYFTDVPNRGCAATCHLGAGPHADKNTKHGLHYTQGEIGDVWHWKAVRTNPIGAVTSEPGYVDDQHFRAPDPLPTKPGERYMGGYFADPQPNGGYEYNFVKLDPKKPLAETYVRPKMLPLKFPVLLSADPTESSHDTAWWIHKANGIPYSAAADTYPVGALIPNILVEPFQGDRADIRGQAQWRAGRWTLETRRLLDTKSKFDVAFSMARPVYLSVGTFNRTQTRHSEHIRPVRVVIEP